jgi:hypothetical protein
MVTVGQTTASKRPSANLVSRSAPEFFSQPLN